MTTNQSHIMSDHELVADAQAGDPRAVDALIGAVRPAVLKYCRSRLATYSGGVDAADDVAQETCVAVLRVLPRYQNLGAPFAAFVYAIASNKVADAQRGFSRSAVLVEEMPEQTEPSPTPEEAGHGGGRPAFGHPIAQPTAAPDAARSCCFGPAG